MVPSRFTGRRSGWSMVYTACAGAALLVALACGGGERPAEKSPATPPPAAEGPPDASSITPAMLALGDSIFHGMVAAGSCQGCHGPDAKGGTGIGANLTDTAWLHSDGSLEGIYNTVKAGVMQPKESSSIMLPMGGSPLNPDQLRAVVAYVYSLSHKVGGS